jgi:hypothetical protein
MLTGPAACGGYFFGCLVRKRDPSLTLSARDDDPDRILVFFEETMSRNSSAARKDFANAAPLSYKGSRWHMPLRERYIYFTAMVKPCRLEEQGKSFTGSSSLPVLTRDVLSQSMIPQQAPSDIGLQEGSRAPK